MNDDGRLDSLKAIRGGLILDGTGRSPQQNWAILLRGSRIAWVGPDTRDRIPPEATVIDADGLLVVPGLFNLHEHITRKQVRNSKPVSHRQQSHELLQQPIEYVAMHAARNALDELNAGVTTIRDFGGPEFLSIHLRRAIAEHLLAGPRVLACGKPVCMTGGHAYHWNRQADGVDEVRKAIREQIRAGADHIKLMATGGLINFPDEDPDAAEFSLEELTAAVTEAHRFHRRCAAHAYATAGIKNAVRAGIDTIEHGVYLDEEATAMMAERGTSLVPTLSGILRLPQQYESLGQTDLSSQIMTRVIAPHRESVRTARAAGVRIGVGTDAGTFVWEELVCLQEVLGWSGQECIEAATRTSAEIVGLADRLGTLEEGKLGDVVLMDAEVLNDVRRARGIHRVLKESRSIDEVLAAPLVSTRI